MMDMGAKGSYVLLMKLSGEQTITVGSLSNVRFLRGYYAYVGSALGGVKSRLSRHLNQNKKLHWHIDYLLQKASITDIIIVESENKVECAIAQALCSQFDSIPGFGASDCHCHSHLFFTAEGRQMKSTIMETLKSLSIKPRLAKELDEK